jgi:type II secretory pathway predicted ATPase ExeA
MYKTFFRLRSNPFNVNPDPRYLYATRHIHEALASLAYGVQRRKGFILLTGEVGTGKTTLLNRLMDWLRTNQVSTAFMFNPRLDVPQFFDFVLNDFGIASDTRDKGQMLQRLNHWLLDRYRDGETAVLVIDEAQNLSAELLEEIRLLTNLETSTEKLLQIILCGQPELELKLREPSLRQLRQRITLRCRTHPLTIAETQSYIAQRLRIAGGNGEPIFTPEAVASVFEYSQGIPRVINLLCEHAMISAFVDQQQSITAATIDAVGREFELDQIPSRPLASNGNGECHTITDALRASIKVRESGNQPREAAVQPLIRKTQ